MKIAEDNTFEDPGLVLAYLLDFCARFPFGSQRSLDGQRRCGAGAAAVLFRKCPIFELHARSR